MTPARRMGTEEDEEEEEEGEPDNEEVTEVDKPPCRVYAHNFFLHFLLSFKLLSKNKYPKHLPPKDVIGGTRPRYIASKHK